jgi:hypothetical protein
MLDYGGGDLKAAEPLAYGALLKKSSTHHEFGKNWPNLAI